VEIIATEGPQVADIWAFACPGLAEVLSTEHTRSCLEKLSPDVGEAFYSDWRRPMLTVVADTSPGTHDLLLSACDAGRYRQLGHHGPHRTCVDNLHEALATLGLRAPRTPSPVNVFENVSIGPGGQLEIVPPTVSAGEALTLRAEMDLVLVISACPMDIALTNGRDRRPKPICVRLHGRASEAGADQPAAADPGGFKKKE
jgi:uncharacterized protein YcgI (DUF1989 family)